MKRTANGRPLVNPHASALEQDRQLRRQQAWDRIEPREKARLISDACEAEERIPLDELEAFANSQRNTT